MIEAYIIQGFGSLNGNGPETEVQVRGGVAEFDLLALTGDLITAGAEGEGYKLIFIANTPGENPKRYTSEISDVMKFNESLSDFTAPTVTTVDVPLPRSYREGMALNFTVHTSESLTVDTTGGTPQIAVTIGTDEAQAAYVSAGTSNELVFSYTVQAGETDTDGISVGALGLNGGTIKDFALNNMDPTLNTVGATTSVLVDTTAPTVRSVAVPSNGSYKEDGVLNFIVNTTEAVNVVGTPQIAVTVGNTAREAAYVADASTSTALLFRYTVVAGETDTDGVLVGTLGLNGGTIKDAAENALNLTLNTVGDTTSVLVDTTAPTLSNVSIASNNAIDDSVANIGNIVTLLFESDEIIDELTLIVSFQSGGDAIKDQNIFYSNDTGNNWAASYVVDKEDSLGDVTYSINFSDCRLRKPAK